MTAAATDFDGFYQAHFGSTVAMTYGLTADLTEAHDIAQEAFCRAWQRWKVVSRYENPVSWVRQVATNLAISRWRRLKVASAYLMRQRPQDNHPDLSPDHVDVVSALRELPVSQRKAIVMHYLLDLPIGEVAEELGVPSGTIKSWLHRGRASLSTSLGDEVRRNVTTPPAQQVREQGDRKTAVKRATITAATFIAVLAATLTGFKLVSTNVPLPPASPSPDPIPTPSPTPIALTKLPGSCAVQGLVLPKGLGSTAAFVTGGDPTGRYLLGSISNDKVFIWDNGIPGNPIELADIDSDLTDINSAGVAVGFGYEPSGMVAYVLHNGTLTPLAGANAEAHGINESGVIVGSVDGRPVRWASPQAEPELLPIPSGMKDRGVAAGITDDGMIVGTLESPAGQVPIRWDTTGPKELPLPEHLKGGFGLVTVTDVRGGWAVGQVQPGQVLPVKMIGVRWNLANSAVEEFPDTEILSTVNHSGWTGSQSGRAAIFASPREVLRLPTNIPGESTGLRLPTVKAISDDGTSLAGEVTVMSAGSIEQRPVRWSCK